MAFCVFQAAIILGPSFLGRDKKLGNALFPGNGATVVSTLSKLGVMYFVFLAGVKMDATMLWRSGKKTLVVAGFGIVLPVLAVGCATFLLKDRLGGNGFNDTTFIILFSIFSGVTSFPVIQPILVQLNLLSSKLGRLAMSAAMMNQTIGHVLMLLVQAFSVSKISVAIAISFIISLFFIVILGIFVVRPIMMSIIRATPEGEPVKYFYTSFILLAVMLVGFFSDILGGNIIAGPMVFGLVIPDGPPLGAAIAAKSETVIDGLLMSIFITSCGMRVDLFGPQEQGSSLLVYSVFFLGCAAKVFGTVIACIYSKMPLSDSLAVGLIMSFKGEVDMIVYSYWLDGKLLEEQTFSSMVVSVAIITGLATPIVKRLSRITRTSMDRHPRRMIQYDRLLKELRVATCIHSKETVPYVLNLMDASYATKETPLILHVLHLVELVGSATPMLISHEKNDENSTSGSLDHILNAFKKFEQQNTNGGFVVEAFTCIAPYNSMDEDICQFAFDKKVALIIIPFYKHHVGGMEVMDRCFQIINPKVLDKAPCSVGILVDRKSPVHVCKYQTEHHVGILFLGGPDDREALSCGYRFTRHPRVFVNVVRFLPLDPRGDDERQRRLDDDLMDDFRNKCSKNDRVFYREVMVRDGEETVSEIRAIDDIFDIIIVGLTQKTSPKLVEGLSEWSENPELGVIGDIVSSSSDSSGRTVTVLVVKQQG
ncbi:cation/H(+) antiporter 15-like [Aristolochia californica]|uniref:cation/H(+) antiporter 15-like n=1 Tax=Aristolochia californica TaxID=171875 RepID=UPI0035DEEF2A